MDDTKELASLFIYDTNEKKELLYNDVNWIFLNESNSSNTVIRFDNMAHLGNVTTFDGAALQLNLTATNPAWAGRPIREIETALKCSAAELISGVQVLMGDGVSIVNETGDSLPIANNIRRMFRNDDVSAHAIGSEFAWHPDEFPNLESHAYPTNKPSLPSDGKFQNYPHDSIHAVRIQSQMIQDEAGNTIIHLPNHGLIHGQKVYTIGQTELSEEEEDNLENEVSPRRVLYQGVTQGWRVIYRDEDKFSLVTERDPMDRVSKPLVGLSVSSSSTASYEFKLFAPKIETYNHGFRKRIKHFTQSITSPSNGIVPSKDLTGAGQIEVKLWIPLREIHDLFAQWIFPFANVKLQFAFTLSAPINSGSAFNAILESKRDIWNVPIDDSNIINFAGIAQTKTEWKFEQSKGNARLYFKRATLLPADHTWLNQKIYDAGLTKRMFFKESQMQKLTTTEQGKIAQNGVILTNSISNLKVAYLFGVPQGALAARDLTINPTGELTSLDLLVNNVPYRVTQVNNRREHFLYLKEHFEAGDVYTERKNANTNPTEFAYKDARSLITWERYNQGNMFIYPIDFKRLGVRATHDMPVQLVASWSPARSDLPPMDWYVVFVKQARLAMSITNNQVSLVKSYGST